MKAYILFIMMHGFTIVVQISILRKNLKVLPKDAEKESLTDTSPNDNQP